jgi:hypothetical protein
VNFPEEKILRDSQIIDFINQSDFSSAADYLFKSQLKNWQLMKANYDALKSIKTKSFWFEGFKLNVQYNPERIKSTSALVDRKSISNRPCFLCVKNLPEEQKGIILKEDFILLCNPYPIFPQHFTIAALEHKPQTISDFFSEFLELSKLLSPRYTMIYNGPACGASAPDHLHFQAGTKNYMPIENDIHQMKNEFGIEAQENDDISTTFINDGLRRIVFVESSDQLLIKKSFEILFNAIKKYSPAEPEPMMNLLCTYDKEYGWSLIIFLRSKHRPESFYKENLEKILISPAAVDLGGVVITPRDEDYQRTDKDLIRQIIDEVSLDQKIFSLIEKEVKSELN